MGMHRRPPKEKNRDNWLSLSNLPAFEPPRKSGTVDPSLIWYWIDYVRLCGQRHRKWKNEYKLSGKDQIVRCWYDEDDPAGKFNSVSLEVTFRDSGIKRFFRQPDDIHFRRRQLFAKKGEPSTTSDLKVAAFNFWKLRTGRFQAQFIDEAIAEVDALLIEKFRPDWTLRIIREWLEWKKAHGKVLAFPVRELFEVKDCSEADQLDEEEELRDERQDDSLSNLQPREYNSLIAPQLPQQSALVSADVLRYYIECLGGDRFLWSHRKAGDMTLTSMQRGRDAKHRQGFFVDGTDGIRRAYVANGADQKTVALFMEAAARTNLHGLVWNKIPHVEIPSAISEIEHQLSLLPRTHSRGGERVIFRHFEQWKGRQGFGGG